MENGKMFLEMSFKEQESIINACLMNCAKLINSKQTENENSMTYAETKAFRDCVSFLYSNKDEIFNESYCLILENMETEKAELPLALYITKMSGKALRKAFYWNSKSASEKVDAETLVNCADCFDSFADIMQADRIAAIIGNVRDSLKEYARNTIAMVNCGYSFKEIAQYNGISENRQGVINSAIVNAVAIVNALDKEWNTLDRIISSDISFKDSISRKAIEKAIISAYKAEYGYSEKHEKAIDWKTALERLKASCYFQFDMNKYRF